MVTCSECGVSFEVHETVIATACSCGGEAYRKEDLPHNPTQFINHVNGDYVEELEVTVNELLTALKDLLAADVCEDCYDCAPYTCPCSCHVEVDEAIAQANFLVEREEGRIQNERLETWLEGYREQ